MEWIVYILIAIIAFVSGFFAEKFKQKDDGIVMINEERVEVIFRDPYEKLVKKKFVNLRIQS